MDTFTIFLIVIITVLTTLLVITGIQVILILRQVNKTLTKANRTVDLVDGIVTRVADPLSNMTSLTRGVKAGLEIADHITAWFREKHTSNQLDTHGTTPPPTPHQ